MRLMCDCNKETETNRMIFSRPLFSPRRSVPALLTLLLLPLAFGLAGCQQGGPLGPAIPVAENVDQAIKDGQVKEDAAQKVAEAGSKDEAVRLYGEVSAYYGAVGKKFAGTENGGAALLKQAETTENGAKNNNGALAEYRGVLKQYPAGAFPALHEKAQTEYDNLVEKMDKENSQTAWYTVMDTLVRALGGSPVVAIVFIAFAVTIVLWPLRIRQFASAKEMQRYQPELNKLRERYKGDMQLAAQKQQEFFKEHKINQFSGCLPALLQWPVTLVMYRVILYYQFHFRDSHFLWINPASARSAQDLPWPLTGAIAHNLGEQDLLLLLFYAVSMFAQSKLTPVAPSADPSVVEQQKLMSTIMPIMFFVMMLQWQLPSAFVLYWLISNVLFVAQQWWINKTLPTPPPFVLSETGASIVNGESPATKPMTTNPKLVSPKRRKK